MKRMMRKQILVRAFLLLLALLGMSSLPNRAAIPLRFIEDYGHVGTIKMLKGQVRDSADIPIPQATVSISNLGKDRNYVIESDENGNFLKYDLPSGKYKIRIDHPAHNIGEFTVRISQGSPFTSGKYMIVKLSPGCASGDSGVKLVSKIEKP